MNIDYDCMVNLKGFMNVFCDTHKPQITPYERSSIERCKHVFKDATVFDLGAAGGLWSHASLQAGAKMVVTFDHASNDEIRENLKSFGEDKFRIEHLHIRGPSTPNPSEGPAVTIDDYIEQNKIDPTFIKMDIEGNEIEALKSAQKTIKRLREDLYFMIEVHPGVDMNEIKRLVSWEGIRQCSGENYIMQHIYHLYYLPVHV